MFVHYNTRTLSCVVQTRHVGSLRGLGDRIASKVPPVGKLIGRKKGDEGERDSTSDHEGTEAEQPKKRNWLDPASLRSALDQAVTKVKPSSKHTAKKEDGKDDHSASDDTEVAVDKEEIDIERTNGTKEQKQWAERAQEMIKETTETEAFKKVQDGAKKAMEHPYMAMTMNVSKRLNIPLLSQVAVLHELYMKTEETSRWLSVLLKTSKYLLILAAVAVAYYMGRVHGQMKVEDKSKEQEALEQQK